MAKPRIASQYRQRHSRNTLIAFFFMLIIVIGSAAYIIDYGLKNRASDEETTDLYVSIVVYSETKNVSGRITINNADDTVFQALIVNEDGSVSGIKIHPLGIYKLYYIGDTNGVSFGPVAYTVATQDALLYDSTFSDIRVTIMTL